LAELAAATALLAACDHCAELEKPALQYELAELAAATALPTMLDHCSEPEVEKAHEVALPAEGSEPQDVTTVLTPLWTEV